MTTNVAALPARAAGSSAMTRVRALLPQGVQLSDEAWHRRHRVLERVLWALVPVLVAVGLIRGFSIGHTLLESSPVIVFGLAGRNAPGRHLTAIFVCLGLLSFDAVLVHFTDGLIEAHFTFFILVPLVALYQDIFAFVAAIGFVAVQHTVMSLIEPKTVFNHAAAQHKPLLWAGIHAGFVIVLVVVILVFWRFAEQTQIELDAVVAEAKAQAARAEAEAAAARETADRLEVVMRQASDGKDRIEAEARLVQEAAARRQAILDRAAGFEENVQQVVVSVASTATQMEALARSLGSSAGETSDRAAAASWASDAVATNVQSVANATTRLSGGIEEIGRQALASASVVQTAVNEASDTNAAVAGLADAVGQIAPVAALINGIASQTRLLALNATIEAARAGEAGKGFAVVATQVQELAGQTAQATADISRQITAIQVATTSAVGAIEHIGETIARVDDIIHGIARSVEQQSASTMEIAQSIATAASSSRTVSTNIEELTHSATTSSGATQDVTRAATSLAHEANELRTEIERFMELVRSA